MTETLRDLAGQNTTDLLNYDEYRPGTHVYVPEVEMDEEDNGQIVLMWHEGLKFHARAAGEDASLLMDGTFETWNKAGTALAQAVEEHFSGFVQVKSVTNDPYVVGDDVTDEVALEIVLDIPGGLSATRETAQRVLWPVEAALYNITDPGTFGSPYIFRRVLEILRKNAETPSSALAEGWDNAAQFLEAHEGQPFSAMRLKMANPYR